MIYKAGLYYRLSKDDIQKGDNMSIKNQREILQNYCRLHGYQVVAVYQDVGWSGKNFDRPDWKRVEADIENGKINMLLTKDLSRLGRNTMTDYYTEVYFPVNKIRYLAVDDRVDINSSADADMMVTFKNFMNSTYLKDTSKKVKSGILSRQRQGFHIGIKAPYGYRKDPEIKGHLLIDENTAPIVRRVYEYAKQGLGISKIRRILTEEKIPRPACTATETTAFYGKFCTDENYFMWSNNSVRMILVNPIYCGDMPGQQRPSISMHSNKRYYHDPEKAFVVENTHEPIIPKGEWEVVQSLIRSRRKELKPENEQYDNIFSHILKCGTCGYCMSTARANRTKRAEIIDCMGYCCNNYRTYGKSACSQHWVEARDLYTSVLADIQKQAQMAIYDPKMLIKSILEKFEQTSKTELKRAEREIKKINTRQAEIVRLFAKLYEDRVSGEISEGNYKMLALR